MLIDDESENSCSNAWFFCDVVIQMSLFHIVDGEYTPWECSSLLWSMRKTHTDNTYHTVLY